jgi:uncharacterized protein (DUF1697 family)
MPLDPYPVTRYAAFLRAVNLAGRRVVKMEHLRRVFESLAYTNVHTFIASGNVVFDSSVQSATALERQIEAALLEALGFPVATFVRPLAGLADVAAFQPFKNAEGASLYVAFVRDIPAKPIARRLHALGNDLNEYRVRGREVYWLMRSRFAEASKSAVDIEKTLGMPATVRNATTVRRMAAKFL